MHTMYAEAWQHLPSSLVDLVCRSSDVGADAVVSAECGSDPSGVLGTVECYGLRQTETWLSLSDVNSLRSQSA
jgi:hypothetical protein